MNFQQKLNNIVRKNNSLLCVGLDSDIDKLPQYIRSSKSPVFQFNKEIIDATHDLVCCYKPNIAFYEAEGADGLIQLKQTIDFLKENYPEIPIILDAKRADIGNTNEGYVKYVFDYFGADGVTLHPYLGKESLKPFLDKKDSGIFILCRTSNPGAGEFQDLQLTGSDKDTSDGVRRHSSEVEESAKPLYQIIARHVAREWNYNGNCGLVVGATYPSELEIVRRIAENLPILIPGVGAQGGDIEKTVKAGVTKNGLNAIINSSRGIIFAGSDEDFAQKARIEAENLRNEINKYRDN